jgi:hypothetical protein
MVESNEEQLPLPLLRAFAPIHRMALGVACGVVLGALIFLMTAILLLKGGPVVGPRLGLLRHYFFGYSVTWPGAFIGLLWGAGAGFLLGWGFALVRNFAYWAWLTSIRSRAEMEQYSDFLDHM